MTRGFLQRMIMTVGVMICLSVSAGIGQVVNLVPNPSFENYDQIPTEPSQFEGYVQNWFVTNQCQQQGYSSGCGMFGITPDYYHTACPNECYQGGVKPVQNKMGDQVPHHGEAYAGIFVTGRKEGVPVNCDPPYMYDDNHIEFISTELTQDMVVGQRYTVGMWISLAEYSMYAAQNMGMIFTTLNPEFDDCDMNDLPTFPVVAPNEASAPIVQWAAVQEKNGWVEIRAEFVADRAYRFLSIGRFGATETVPVIQSAWCLNPLTMQTKYGSDEWAYYYIDNVTVQQSTYCWCDYINIELLNSDADYSCCKYWRLTIDPAGYGACVGAGEPAKIRVTSCNPELQLQLNTHYPPTQPLPPGAVDRYRVVGDTYEWIGNRANLTPGPIPNPQQFGDDIPGFICLVDPANPPNPANPGESPCCRTSDPVRPCLKFEILDAAGNVLCEKKIETWSVDCHGHYE